METTRYIVEVDYDARIEDVANDHAWRGNYSWSNGKVTTKNFPTERVGKANIEIILVNFGHFIDKTENPIRELGKLGLRPAEACELLAFGKKHPRVQREVPIVALGSVWNHWSRGCNAVFLSSGYDAEYKADLTNPYKSWFSDMWFAAVRK